jgi:uncharacterized protein YndB with AHSA1/START domain
LIAAPRHDVYRALLDPEAVGRWKVPEGMTSEIHRFEPCEGGAFRVSLTYEAPGRAGKTAERTDTYAGCFTRLVPNQLVVEAIEFETADPSLQGQMTVTTTLADGRGGTLLTLVHEGLPSGVRPEDNELGTRQALDKLAAMLETV